MDEIFLWLLVLVGGGLLVFRGIPYLLGMLLGSRGIIGDIANIILWVVRVAFIGLIILGICEVIIFFYVKHFKLFNVESMLGGLCITKQQWNAKRPKGEHPFGL